MGFVAGPCVREGGDDASKKTEPGTEGSTDGETAPAPQFGVSPVMSGLPIEEDEEGKYLIERHSLRVAPSIGTVIELQRCVAARPTPSKPSALVVGDPSFGGSGCSRDDVDSDSSACWAQSLPGARKEARRINSLLEDTDAYEDSVKKMVGDDAGKVAVVEAMRSCDVIHLATHGEPSAVLLGGATRAEGVLSMAEVQRLDLEARLVVLSECDSFKGELKADGVIGITRAFVAAGAPTLVASLWEVSDVATRKLMTRFYDALLGPEAAGDVAVALQARVGTHFPAVSRRHAPSLKSCNGLFLHLPCRSARLAQRQSE